MQFWSRRRRRPRPDDVPETRSALDEIQETTPHRFRVWLTDAADREAALRTLSGDAWLRDELSVAATGDPDGRALDLASTFSPRTAAIQRPLNVLKRAGIDVRGFEALDLVTELDERSLERAVEAWDRFGNNGPHRHRLEVLAGEGLLEVCMDRSRRATDTGPGRRPAWRFAGAMVVFNTPGAETGVLQQAAEASDASAAESLVGAAGDRASLTQLTGEPLSVPDDALAALIRRRGYLSERASHLAFLLPSPLPEAVTGALCEIGSAGGDRAVSALSALRNAQPSQAVRDTIETALGGADANVQAAALDVLAHLWGTDARPTWQAFLASRSTPLRWTAEAVIGLHGTEEDLADAAAHLAGLARTRSAVPMTPPRGNEIVDLLVRHRDQAVARAALDDLSARWDRLGADLREWLAEHQPWLDPARRDDHPVEQEAEPEGSLTWPAPTIERDGDTLTLSFDDGASHSEARDRFEELAIGHPLVDVLDGDREWLTVRIASVEPEAVVLELWESAGSVS